MEDLFGMDNEQPTSVRYSEAEMWKEVTWKEVTWKEECTEIGVILRRQGGARARELPWKSVLVLSH